MAYPRKKLIFRAFAECWKLIECQSSYKDNKKMPHLKYCHEVIKRVNERYNGNEIQTRNSCVVLVKVSIFRNNRDIQSYPRLDFIMLHKIPSMNRDLKHQDNLKHHFQYKIWIHPYFLRHPIQINLEYWTYHATYTKFLHNCKAYNLSHHKCRILISSYLIRMEYGAILYTPIIYSWVTGCGWPRLVKEHHYGA